MPESSTDVGDLQLPSRRLLSDKWFASFLIVGAFLGMGVAIFTSIANDSATTLPQAVLASSLPSASVAALIVGIDQVLRAANRRASSLGDSLQAEAYGEVRGLALLIPVAATPACALTLLVADLNGRIWASLALGVCLTAALVIIAAAVTRGAHFGAGRVSPQHATVALNRLSDELSAARKGEAHRQRVIHISQIQRDLDLLIRKKSATESDWEALSKRIADLHLPSEE